MTKKFRRIEDQPHKYGPWVEDQPENYGLGNAPEFKAPMDQTTDQAFNSLRDC